MNHAITLPALQAGRHQGIRDILVILALAGAMALAAQVKILLPFSPVPFTLQTLPVLMAGYLVGWRTATWGIALYTLLGLAGAPFFAVTSGATAGYLAAFLAAPALQARLPLAPALGMAVTQAFIYALGAGWLVLALGMSLPQAMSLGVAPFLAGDILKWIAACAIVRRFSRQA